ncbi:MAG TPA: UDP-3-O-(3-hydroxymyristoyl)glucosamine N-acyltransferase [Nitrospiraceae bacterium]|nr:UDP-3-O-(3-hydroxymyristoyl)glucosamine N-acyltransferase [Nitrospiraceae bacterium]
MATPQVPSPITLAEIHRLVGGTVHGNDQTKVSELAGLGEANPRALSFVANDKALKSPEELRAGALLVHRHLPELAIPQIVVGNPLLAFAQVAQRFFVHPAAPRGIAEDITQGADVRIGPNPSIWPFVTLGDRVTIGARVTLYPGVFIGPDSTIGDDSVLYPNVVVREGCSLGARVIVHSGTVIGSDGFGYVQHRGRHQKIPQLGGVVIEDDVELGANVTIDRATLGATIIKQGTKVDNLVQIAHNVSIGEHSIVVAQVGIAGSTAIGHHVMIGGQAGLADHIQIGDQVMIAARAGVNRSLEPNQIVSGAPVMPHETWMKAQAVIPRLPELRQLVRNLEQRVATLEEQLKNAPAQSARNKKPNLGKK